MSFAAAPSPIALERFYQTALSLHRRNIKDRAREMALAVAEGGHKAAQNLYLAEYAPKDNPMKLLKRAHQYGKGTDKVAQDPVAALFLYRAVLATQSGETPNLYQRFAAHKLEQLSPEL